ncbi:MAG: glycosyltransferase [Pseudomonadota bacterium]
MQLNNAGNASGAPSAQRAYLIDLSRTARRLGMAPTGIDRVERRYLEELLSRGRPLWGVVRTPLGNLLLNQAALRDLKSYADGIAPPSGRDLLSRLPMGRSEDLQTSETAVRALAFARAPRGRLAAMLRRHLPGGFVYMNVGHSALTARRLRAIRGAGASKVEVMVHDLLPLEFPEWHPNAAKLRMDQILRATFAHADTLICPSFETQKQVAVQAQKKGWTGETLTAHLGPGLAPCQSKSSLLQNSFLCLGTLDARKNQAFLLQVWQRLYDRLESSQSPPALLFAGRVGFGGADIVSKINHLQRSGVSVEHLDGPDDTTIAKHLASSRALLAPSLAEGFGLAPLEAACANVTCIAHPLAVTREVLGDIPVYADATDIYAWCDAVVNVMRQEHAEEQKSRNAGNMDRPELPSWKAHFAAVLGEI